MRMIKPISKVLVAVLCLAITIPLFSKDTQVLAGTVYTGLPGLYYLPNRESAPGGDYTKALMEYTGIHMDASVNGTVKKWLWEWRMLPYCAYEIGFGEPVVGGCDKCRELARNTSVYSVRVFLEDDNGREYVSRNGVVLDEAALAESGIDFEHMLDSGQPIRAGIELTQNPGAICPSCGKHIGDEITIDGIYSKMRTVVISSQPSSVTANIGGTASFQVGLSAYRTRYNVARDYYKWSVNSGGGWTEISDGVQPSGEVYSGSDTARLTVSNVNDSLRGAQYRCALKGTFGVETYTSAATLSVPVTPTVTPTPVPTIVVVTPTPIPTVTPTPSPTVTPTPSPTATPTPRPTATPTPRPTATPTASPTPPPVTPGPGSRTDYTPSTSSSAYIRPGSSSSQGAGSSSAKGSSSGGSGSSQKSNDTHTGSIDGLSTGAGEDTKIILPDGGSSSGGGRSSYGGGRSSSAKVSGSGSSGSSSASGSAKRSGADDNGNRYVMKNGVLYVLDDENTNVGTEGELPGKESTSEETYESEEAYSAADLAAGGTVYDRELTQGFFDSIWGIVTVAAVSLLVLALLLFFLFFGVIVLGEVEEHDDVFELCAIRLLRRKDGNWCVKLGTAFDDNAALKLRTGLLFAKLFEDWDLIGEVSGIYEGEITGSITQGMMVYRRNIRRSV